VYIWGVTGEYWWHPKNGVSGKPTTGHKAIKQGASAMRNITINSMTKTDNGHWEAEGSLEGNPFVAKTIKYGKELIFKVVEGSDVAKSLTESDFSRGDRVSIAAACKSVRIALEISGQDQLEAPMKPGKRQASATSGTKAPRQKKEKTSSPEATITDVDNADLAIDDAERTRKEIEAIRALLAAAPPASDLDEMEAELNEDEDEDSDES
jgi:hypothetical protein